MSTTMDDLNITACFRATVNVTEAVSPAFIIEGLSTFNTIFPQKFDTRFYRL